MFHVMARNLSKDYRIYSRPIDRLIEAITKRPRHRLFHALRNVSFLLEPGQSLGIIGDNGAGKSTLLKILTGTLTPTSGEVQMGGRVAALLELGAGFHPEFTGRQNIALTCSLLGIPADEIAAREAEIIAFSELESFIDQPVKTYSSGMYIRLGFAIATSVDPDILIIDEALAVGDLKFQRKCIERMGRFRDRGRTMLFCSHSMYHVQEICKRVLWMDRGEVRQMGPAPDVVAEYEDFCRSRRGNGDPNAEKDKGPAMAPDKECFIRDLVIETPEGEPVKEFRPFMDVVFRMEAEAAKEGVLPQFGFALVMSDQTIFSACITHHDDIDCGPYAAGERITVRLHVREIPLKTGLYRLTAGIADNQGLLWYDLRDVGPLLVRDEEPGVGLVTFRRTWDVRSNGKQ